MSRVTVGSTGVATSLSPSPVTVSARTGSPGRFQGYDTDWRRDGLPQLGSRVRRAYPEADAPLVEPGRWDRMRLDDETREWAAALSEVHRAAVIRWQGEDRFYEQVQRALAGEVATAEAVDIA